MPSPLANCSRARPVVKRAPELTWPVSAATLWASMVNHRTLLRLGPALLLLVTACGSRPSVADRPQPEARPGPPVQESTPAPESTAAKEPEPPPVRPETAPRREPARPELPQAIVRTFPDAWTVTRRTDPFPIEVVLDRKQAVLGYSVYSDSAGTTAVGYAGPVPIQLLLDARARPRRIYLLDNQETPAYLELVVRQGLLERLLDYDPARPDSIDAVTLATSSSRAIIAAVTRTADRVAREITGR